VPKKKVVISCAITGAIHTPTMSPYLPITPQQIAESSIEAAKAGAAILHLHARDPKDGRPVPDPQLFLEFMSAIKADTDAVLNMSTGGGLTMSVEQRLSAAISASPEMCSLNMGSMNFGIFPLTQKYPTWRHPWEPDYLEATRGGIFSNTFADIERIVEILWKGHGTRFEHECYDVGHLYSLAHFVDRKIIEPPFLVQTIVGILGGIGADWDNMHYMKKTADKLFGDSYVWSVLAAGKHQMPFATQSALLGGHVRVGLEDSLYIERGELSTSNAQQVAKVRSIIEALGLEPATPAETRALLKLKGAGQVRF
jgi:uncharacterized protein (DUF849 family)